MNDGSLRRRLNETAIDIGRDEDANDDDDVLFLVRSVWLANGLAIAGDEMASCF